MNIKSAQSKTVPGPIAMWFMNDTMDEPTMRHQLDELADKGFGAVLLHPRDGMTTPFSSRRWYEQSAFIIRECIRRGIRPWFYDENPCPSGSAGGMVSDLHPELVCQALSADKRTVRPEKGVIRAVFKDASRLLRIYAAEADESGGRAGPWRDVTEWAGLVGDHWFVQGSRTRGYGPTHMPDTCDAHWRAWVDRIRWVLEWKPPEDRAYHVMAVCRKLFVETRPIHYVDLIHPESTRRFIELTYQRAYDQLGPELFGRLEAGFSDEPKLFGPYHWSSILPEDYQKAYGRDIFGDLPILIDDAGLEGEIARLRYRRLLGRLWKERFWDVMADWCRGHGMLLVGHSSPEEDPVMQACYTPALMQGLSTMDWPGCDQITSRFEKLQDELSPLIAASVAHQHGKEHVLVESLGVSGEGITPARMKRILDHLAILGCDLFCLHGQLYSIAGDRKREAPPSIFVQQPYWPFISELNDHLMEWTRWHGLGEAVRPIGVVYPTAAFESSRPDDAQAGTWAIALDEIIASLLKAGLSFDLVSDLDIANPAMAHCEGGRLHIGKARYESLVLPDIGLLEQPAADAIVAWNKEGLQVLSLGKIRMAGMDRLVQLGESTSIDAMVKQLVQRHRSWMKTDAGEIVYAHSRIRDGHVHRALWNPGNRPAKVTFTRTGDSIELGPDGVEFVVDDKAPKSDALPASARVVELNGPWVMKPSQSNVLRLSHWRMRTPDGVEQNVSVPAKSADVDWMPAEFITSGFFPLTPKGCILECDVEVEGIIGELHLNWDVKAIGASAKLWINDRLVDLSERKNGLWFDSYSRQLDGCLREGRNPLRLEIDPPEADERALIDPLYLCGRFLVPDPARLRITKGAEVKSESPLDWAKAGYPHYSGEMIYSTEFSAPKDCRRIWIEWMEGQRDPVEVRLNGKTIGRRCWGPWRVELTDALKTGRNLLEISSANTLINRIEGVAQPSGVIGKPRLKVSFGE
jgi:hypothetical protein